MKNLNTTSKALGHHRARKRFGQNFLQSEAVIHAILDAIHAGPTDHVVEIGPGLGALTKPLLKQLPQLTVIEIDRDLQAYWSTYATPCQLELISADALTVDYGQWKKPIRLLGNLPYNISTPLLFHLLDYTPFIQDMYFMLQKEVALRLAASVGNKNYGRLSIMMQYCCEVSVLFEVPPEAFEPAPKVDSAVVRLKPYTVCPYEPVDRVLLKSVVAQSFAMRRKTIANNLKKVIPAQELQAIGIDPGMRPEQISLQDYVRLTHYLHTLHE